MLNSSTNSGAHDVFHAAKFYNSLNYSVIPVYGNAQPERPKVAAVDWKQYQMRRAGDKEFDRWFLQAGFQGLAIVTGSISRLVVLDFDDAQPAGEFALAYPHLTETRTVQSATRHTPHYYYALSAAHHVASRKAAGVDLLSDGCYVVAPPTEIGDGNYRLVRGGQPRILTQSDIDLIEQFLAKRSVDNSTSSVTEDLFVGAQRAAPVIESQRQVEKSRHVNARTLIELYCRFAPQIGRNEALFRQAIYARDCGWSIEEVTNTLAETHVRQPSNQPHVYEPPEQRRREAAGTIRSAFSRPARRHIQASKYQPALPGTLREIFLKNNQVALLRVLDGLFMNHVKSGRLLTEKTICVLLKNSVGRHSILKALKSHLPDGTVIFEQVNPSPGTPTHTDVAAEVTAFPEQNMLFVGVTEPNKTGGRPPAHYRMPDISRLCAAFNVKYITGDALEHDDLGSIKKYRQGLHRELIKRRPGLYARAWLATRLGITVRTMQRYRQDANIQVKPVYRQIPITWHTLSYIPVGVPTNGVFLEDETGKRYPPLPAIAQKLLKQKIKIRCLFQCENHYSVNDSCQLSVVSCQFTAPKSSEFANTDTVGAWRAMPSLTNDALPENSPSYPKLITTKNSSQPQPHIMLPVQANISSRYIPKSKRYYRQPLQRTVHEETANYLYTSLKALCPAKEGYLSLPAARRLVEEYGSGAVKKALRIVSSRRNIATPAGFVISWLRSEAKAWQNLSITG